MVETLLLKQTEFKVVQDFFFVMHTNCKLILKILGVKCVFAYTRW